MGCALMGCAAALHAGPVPNRVEDRGFFLPNLSVSVTLVVWS